MNIFAFTYPNNPDVQILLEELSTTLSNITGDSGNSSFNVQDFDFTKDAFLLISNENQPLACGSLRNVSETVCELKRMYSRVKDLGSEVLVNLEQKAKDMGYQNIILSTRLINTNAVNLYLKHEYEEIPPFGKYKETAISICFGKEI